MKEVHLCGEFGGLVVRGTPPGSARDSVEFNTEIPTQHRSIDPISVIHFHTAREALTLRLDI